MQAVQTTPRIDQQVYRSVIDLALGGHYKESRFLAKGFERVGDLYCTSFVFPLYDKVIPGEELDHVSANQINEAIIEAILCAMVGSILDGSFDYDVDIDWYTQQRPNWVTFQQNITYRKLLVPGEEATLRVGNLTTSHRRLRRRFLSFSTSVEGFVSGDSEWLLPVNALIAALR